MWFEIKVTPYGASGARHILEAISLAKHQPEEVKKNLSSSAKKCILCLLWNFVIVNLTDEKSNIREQARRRVQKSRSNKSSKKVGEFKIPELNFLSKEYHITVSWLLIDVTEPLVTKATSDPEVNNYTAAKHLF